MSPEEIAKPHLERNPCSLPPKSVRRPHSSDLACKTRFAIPSPGWIYLRIAFCIFLAGFTLYFYIDKQNDLTELRLAIPVLAKEVKGIQEENIRLRYEIERFESPIHLMELLRKPEFSHLRYPYVKDVLVLEEE